MKVKLKKCKKCAWYYFDKMTKDNYCDYYKENIENLSLCAIIKNIKD